ncbi:MAG: cob(I)yrinic acid a,c-diamide adenosyltransferase [Nitrospirae bacterium]|nr:cob(I)yrinic acid a,c-diamide adenosyltransferase [Nitrospirota bacterium]MBF0539967.1 cob(I)yrinic acid a,c-diamide adenosyltransferase [Nitrospirota bacterium]
MIILYTGNGKGKTTAALGQMYRAIGQGMRVCIIQFIKGKWKTGEMLASQSFSNNLTFKTMGEGFTWNSKDINKDIEAARFAWETAKDSINSSKYDMVILDELTYLIKYKIITNEEVIEFLKNRPNNIHIIITGRDASNELIEVSDLVTEMKEIKHPYKSGIEAIKGIEY